MSKPKDALRSTLVGGATTVLLTALLTVAITPDVEAKPVVGQSIQERLAAIRAAVQDGRIVPLTEPAPESIKVTQSFLNAFKSWVNNAREQPA